MQSIEDMNVLWSFVQFFSPHSTEASKGTEGGI